MEVSTASSGVTQVLDRYRDRGVLNHTDRNVQRVLARSSQLDLTPLGQEIPCCIEPADDPRRVPALGGNDRTSLKNDEWARLEFQCHWAARRDPYTKHRTWNPLYDGEPERFRIRNIHTALRCGRTCRWPPARPVRSQA